MSCKDRNSGESSSLSDNAMNASCGHRSSGRNGFFQACFPLCARRQNRVCGGLSEELGGPGAYQPKRRMFRGLRWFTKTTVLWAPQRIFNQRSLLCNFLESLFIFEACPLLAQASPASFHSQDVAGRIPLRPQATPVPSRPSALAAPLSFQDSLPGVALWRIPRESTGRTLSLSAGESRAGDF